MSSDFDKILQIRNYDKVAISSDIVSEELLLFQPGSLKPFVIVKVLFAILYITTQHLVYVTIFYAKIRDMTK